MWQLPGLFAPEMIEFLSKDKRGSKYEAHPLLVVGWATHWKHVSQIESSPQAGRWKRNGWNHHLAFFSWEESSKNPPFSKKNKYIGCEVRSGKPESTTFLVGGGFGWVLATNKKQQPPKTPPPTITANINRKESNIIWWWWWWSSSSSFFFLPPIFAESFSFFFQASVHCWDNFPKSSKLSNSNLLKNVPPCYTTKPRPRKGNFFSTHILEGKVSPLVGWEYLVGVVSVSWGDTVILLMVQKSGQLTSWGKR